jgi:hypothetical protein
MSDERIAPTPPPAGWVRITWRGRPDGRETVTVEPRPPAATPEEAAAQEAQRDGWHGFWRDLLLGPPAGGASPSGATAPVDTGAPVPRGAEPAPRRRRGSLARGSAPAAGGP